MRSAHAEIPKLKVREFISFFGMPSVHDVRLQA
jgi:hypothetical protein